MFHQQLIFSFFTLAGNVVWLDNLSAIRALMGLSKPIKNLEKLRVQEPKSVKSAPKIKKEEEDKSDADSDVIMIEDDNDERKAKQKGKVSYILSLVHTVTKSCGYFKLCFCCDSC